MHKPSIKFNVQIAAFRIARRITGSKHTALTWRLSELQKRFILDTQTIMPGWLHQLRLRDNTALHYSPLASYQKNHPLRLKMDQDTFGLNLYKGRKTVRPITPEQ